MTISTRQYADGRTVYIRKDKDGNTHELNEVETQQYLKAKAYKADLAKKVGTGAAIGTGMAASEVVLGGVGMAAEAVALAPALLTIGTIAAVGAGLVWMFNNTPPND